MARDYLKKAEKTAMTDASDVRETVMNILADIEAGGDAAARGPCARHPAPAVCRDDGMECGCTPRTRKSIFIFFRNLKQISRRLSHHRLSNRQPVQGQNCKFACHR